MKVSTLAEIREMDNQMVIPAVTATVVSIQAQKSGGTADKPWTLQKIDLSQGNQKMAAVIWNHDPLPASMKGKQVTMLAFQGDRGWTGLFADDNEYNGKTTRQIKMTQAGTIEAIGTGTQPQPEQDSGEGDYSPQPKPSQKPEPVYQPKPATPPPNEFSAGVFGGTVGMAIKEACIVVNGIGTDPFSPEYCKQIWQFASNLIRVSQALEQGKLAPKPTETNNQN